MPTGKWCYNVDKHLQQDHFVLSEVWQDHSQEKQLMNSLYITYTFSSTEQTGFYYCVNSDELILAV